MSESVPFLLPPPHRLFAIFDDAEAGRRAVGELFAGKVVDRDDVWIFHGDEGIENLDPHLSHRGLPLHLLHIVQRIYTNDREYAEELLDAVRRGGMVVAVKASEKDAQGIAHAMWGHGGRTFAYGAHLNFVPLPGAAGQSESDQRDL